MPLLLSNDDVADLLTVEESVSSLRDAVAEWARGDANAIPRHNFFAPAAKPGHFFNFGIMSGGSKEQGLFCIRIMDDIVYYEKHETGITRKKYSMEPGTYCALLLLFSTANAEPLAIMPDGLIQHMRVAGETAVGVDVLANPDASTISMLGSGGMARSFAHAIKAVRDIKRIKVFSPTSDHREAYAAEMARELGIEVVAVDSPEEAVRGTEIVCICTDSLTPVFSTDWLEPGMLVCSVGGGGGAGDVHGDLTKFSGEYTISTDDLVSTEERGGGYMIGYSYFAGSDEDFADIPPEAMFKRPDERRPITRILDVVSGEAQGRAGRDDAIHLIAGGYTTVGFAVLAGIVFRKAKERALGHDLPLEWFVQKIRD